MLTSFKQQYDAIDRYISANPNSILPAAAELIHLETQQISAIVSGYQAKKSEDAAVGYVNHGSGDNGWSENVLNIKTQTSYETNATLTHQSSNNICKSGARGRGCVR